MVPALEECVKKSQETGPMAEPTRVLALPVRLPLAGAPSEGFPAPARARLPLRAGRLRGDEPAQYHRVAPGPRSRGPDRGYTISSHHPRLTRPQGRAYRPRHHAPLVVSLPTA